MATASFKFKAGSALGVGPTTIYTVPASTTTVVLGLTVTNTTAGTVTAGARATDATGPTTAYIGGKAVSLPTGAAEIFVSKHNPMVLETGDSLSIDGNTAASMDYVLSYMEIA